MTSMERLAQAVGLSIERLKAEHPHQFAEAERQLECDLTAGWVIEKLPRDEAYDALVKLTDDETDIGRIVAAAAPMVLNLVMGLVGGAL
jgi:hypothetical protein